MKSENQIFQLIVLYICLELVTIVLISNYSFSFSNILVLSLFNLVFMLIFKYIFSISENQLLKEKKIYNEFKNKSIIPILVLGLSIVIISFLNPFKFFTLGFSLTFISLFPLIFKRIIERLSSSLRKINYKYAVTLFRRRLFFTMISIYLFPLLIDFHITILSIPKKHMMIIVGSYILIIFLINLVSLFIKSNER